MFSERPYCFNAQALADDAAADRAQGQRAGGHLTRLLLAMRMLAGLSSRLQGLLQDVAAHALHSAGPQRVIGYRCATTMARRTPDPITVPLPVSTTIALRPNLTPEYFSRAARTQAAEPIEVGCNEGAHPRRGSAQPSGRWAPSARPVGCAVGSACVVAGTLIAGSASGDPSLPAGQQSVVACRASPSARLSSQPAPMKRPTAPTPLAAISARASTGVKTKPMPTLVAVGHPGRTQAAVGFEQTGHRGQVGT